MKNLVELHLAGNYLGKLPEEISMLKSLQLIDVNQNRIKTLPKTFTQLNQLSHFSADDNQLSYLPCGACALEYILCTNDCDEHELKLFFQLFQILAD